MATSQKPRKRKPQKKGTGDRARKLELRKFKKMNSREQFDNMYNSLAEQMNQIDLLVREYNSAPWKEGVSESDKETSTNIVKMVNDKMMQLRDIMLNADETRNKIEAALAEGQIDKPEWNHRYVIAGMDIMTVATDFADCMLNMQQAIMVKQ